MTNTEQEAKLIRWLETKVEQAKANGEEMFIGVPDKWYESGLHCCNSGHVNSWYIKSEALRGCVCPSCHQPSHMFPHDTTEQELLSALI